MRVRSHEGLQKHRGLPRSEGQGLISVGIGPITRRRRVTIRYKRRYNKEAIIKNRRDQKKLSELKKTEIKT